MQRPGGRRGLGATEETWVGGQITWSAAGQGQDFKLYFQGIREVTGVVKAGREVVRLH